MSKEPKPSAKAGDQVLVRYLENPNAVLRERPGRVVRAVGDLLDVEVERPRAVPVRLFGIPLHEGEATGATLRPHWAPLPTPAKK